MVALTRGRVIRAEELGEAKSSSEGGYRPIATPIRETRPGRIVRREELEARTEASAIVEAAKREAERIVTEAKNAARDTADRAAREAEEHEQAKLAAGWLALRAREEKRADADLERAVQLATVLGERLIGAALEVDPAKAIALARHALSEARGARRATILAHPDDAAALAARLDALGMPEGTVNVVADDALGRGSLAIQTELGMVDARLRPQLERLAGALREALRSG